MNCRQTAATSQVNNVLKNGKPVQFAMLFPVIKPLLDRDRAMQLTILYDRLNERKISKDVFVKHMRGLVDDHILKLAVAKLQEQVSCSSQVASCTQFVAQQQHTNSSPQSLKQQPQNMQAKLQSKVDDLTKDKIALENHLKVALSEVESLLAQKSSWEKERTVLGNKLKHWRARAVEAESSNSELASKLQASEAIFITKLEVLQSVHNAELKKLQTEIEKANHSFQDGYSNCADKFAISAVDVTRKLFENYVPSLTHLFLLMLFEMYGVVCNTLCRM